MVVEDEESIAESVAYNLRNAGHKVLLAATGEAGLRLARESDPDLVILDLMLPAISGQDVCRILREESSVPIIMLTAVASEPDRVKGLEMGADDYVVKPFSMRELMARVSAVLRRQKETEEQPSVYRVGDLEIDTGRHTAKLKGTVLSLSPKEFALLALLAAFPGQVFSRARLLDRAWGADAYVEEHTIDVHVRWLRTKIEEDPSQPRRLITVRGVGYKLSEQG